MENGEIILPCIIEGYFVSNKGFVYAKEDGDYCRIIGSSNKGYRMVHLPPKDYLAHRLVAISFIPNPNNYPEINHLDGVKDNNNVENLEWCTRSQNIIHSYKMGLQRAVSGGDNHSSILTDEQAIEVYEGVKAGIKSKVFIERYGITKSVIGAICRGETYQNLNLTPFLRMNFLTDEQKAFCKELYLSGQYNTVQLGKKFNLSHGQVINLLKKECPEEFEAQRLKNTGKITEEIVRAIRADHVKGEKCLNKKYGVSAITIVQITKYRTWKHVTI